MGHDFLDLLFDLRSCVGLALLARESLMNRSEVSVRNFIVARACRRRGPSDRALEEHGP